MLLGHRCCCESIKDYKNAIRYYENASEINPFAIESMLHLGFTFEKMGELLEAIRCFKKVLRRDIYNLIATEKIGYLYFKLNMHEKGIKYLLDAREINPHNA